MSFGNIIHRPAKKPMNRFKKIPASILILIPIVLLLAAAAYLSRFFIRDVILLPVYHFFWLARLVIGGIHQEVFYGVLLALTLIMTLFLLSPGRAIFERPPSEQPPIPRGRLSFWNLYLSFMYTGTYSEAFFDEELRRLFFSVMAFRHHSSPREVERLIQSGQLEVPDSIRKALFTRTDNKKPPVWPVRFFRLFTNRKPGRAEWSLAKQRQIEQLIDYMNSQLEDV